MPIPPPFLWETRETEILLPSLPHVREEGARSRTLDGPISPTPQVPTSHGDAWVPCNPKLTWDIHPSPVCKTLANLFFNESKFQCKLKRIWKALERRISLLLLRPKGWRPGDFLPLGKMMVLAGIANITGVSLCARDSAKLLNKTLLPWISQYPLSRIIALI